MISVLSITGTLFFIISIGYLSLRWQFLNRNTLNLLISYVLYFALPAVIFNALSNQVPSEIINLNYLLPYLIATIIVLILGYLISNYLWGTNPTASVFNAAGMACANSGFVGYPLLILALPAVAQTALALNMLVENLIIIPLILILAEYASSKKQVGWDLFVIILRRLVSNPLVIAILISLLVILTDIEIPDFVTNIIYFIAQSGALVCLFVIGGTLFGVTLSNYGFKMYGIVLGKLIFLPFVVFIAFKIFPFIMGIGLVNDDLRKAAIIMASTPAMTLYPILAARFGEADQASACMLVMTILSFFTMSGILLMLGV